ncbi:MarR family transcriptional regulator [Leuconostoc carnosum]|uniref:MarR family transcriptional regulator n=1 Tax=Leuconostoc carnosum TaxID=1252 RepID=UPI00123C2ACF|nr:MarR family transcriptional regulator [Leuconostoc carnosum]KAA8370898.1 MarR family transcriptional regulator [Leuconostoc carnosum]KAA8382541.1 MarR family transcriptional regulator [Leuconostoc carnosum]
MVQDEHLYDELCLSVYNTNRYFHHLYEYVLDKYDLSYLQYMCLLIIHKRQSVKLMDIGVELELSSNTLTPVIDKLVNKLWVVKTQNTTDRRSRVLEMAENKTVLFEKILSEVTIMRDELIRQSGRSIADVLEKNKALNSVLKNMLREQETVEEGK